MCYSKLILKIVFKRFGAYIFVYLSTCFCIQNPVEKRRFDFSFIPFECFIDNVYSLSV